MRGPRIELEKEQRSNPDTLTVDMGEGEQKLSAIDKPQIPKERWATKIKLEQGFKIDASLAEMQERAIELLGSPETSLTGAELVLGRRVDGSESDITMLTLFSKTAEEAFWLLIFQKSIEDMMTQKGQTTE